MKQAARQVRIGLLGGSFDPVHLAHVRLARTALDHLAAASVHLIPAAAPWQRAPLATSADHRAAMVEAAIADQPGLVMNPVEINRGGPSYTVDTLRTLIDRDAAAQRTGIRYVWVLGADQLENFCTWHQWEHIVELADLAVAARPGSEPAPPPALERALARHGSTLHQLPMPEMPVSGSQIRKRLADRQSVDDLVSEAVLRYINLHHLYQV